MKLALGTAQFGLDYGVANQWGQVSLEEARKLIKEAADRGVDMLDTAISYGESECMLGQSGIEGWKVVTKLPAAPYGCADIAGWAEIQALESMRRLRVSQLYGVLLHRPEQLLGAQGRELFCALERLKALNYTQKIGVSVYSPEELDSLFSSMRFDLVQAPLNILDRRLCNSGWAQRLKREGVELHVRSVFLQGLLLMSAEQRPAKFARWESVWIEWERWLREIGVRPLEACLRYVYSVEEVDKIVVGVERVAQLLEVLAPMGGPLPSFPKWPSTTEQNLVNPVLWGQL